MLVCELNTTPKRQMEAGDVRVMMRPTNVALDDNKPIINPAEVDIGMCLSPDHHHMPGTIALASAPKGHQGCRRQNSQSR